MNVDQSDCMIHLSGRSSRYEYQWDLVLGVATFKHGYSSRSYQKSFQWLVEQLDKYIQSMIVSVSDKVLFIIPPTVILN